MNEILNVEQIGRVEVTYTERGTGQPVLLLHGGAGPMSVVPWAELLARTRPARVITPTHPGFMSTPRPDSLTDIRGLARLYAELIQRLDLGPTTVIGNSIGGWIAAELALLAPNLLDKLVLVDAVGIEVPGHPVVDVFSISLDELSRVSYYDPARFRIDPSKLTPEQKAVVAGNFSTLRRYAGNMTDAKLRTRLHGIARPALVVWGEADRVVDREYGRAFADAIPDAKFQLLAGTGHVPQVETPQLLADTVWPFIASQAP
jgi:pimeloyl-ACP methyl ester carboxylesterase